MTVEQENPYTPPAPIAIIDKLDNVNWINIYLGVIKNYVLFEGRARRKEYWVFVLINIIVSIVFGFICGFIGMPKLANVYSLAVFLPSIAVGIRRMHDTDHSGWWIIVPFVNLWFLCIAGDAGDNRFGADPKE